MAVGFAQPDLWGRTGARLYLQKIVIDEIVGFSVAAQSESAWHWVVTKPVLLGGILGFIVINLLLDSIETS